jgi:DNA-binding HxlR family transcriptional regulator/putative sterol carrier protein
VTTRAYGQYCGFARALEVVGERWAMLIVRDLLVAPKRFSDLLRGLPGIPTNVLTARLKELEEAGIARRAVRPPPERSIVYELTDYGKELDTVVLALGRWGAKTLGEPRPEEVVTIDSLIMAMRTTFHPEAASGVNASFELHVGAHVLHMQVEDGALVVAEGAATEPDLIIEASPGIKHVMSGEMSPAEAIKNGTVQLRGDRKLLKRFSELFRIEPSPAPAL